MSSFFTNHIRTQLFTTPTLFVGQQIRVVLLREAPAFETGDGQFVTISTVSELLALPGWREVSGSGYPFAGTLTATPYKYGTTKNNYLTFTRYPFTGLVGEFEVKAVAFCLIGTFGGKVDPIIFVTTTPFDIDPLVVRAADGITANPDIGLIVPPAPTNRWLLNWADAPTPAAGQPAPTKIDTMVEGPLAISRGAPPFEVSHTQHIWLYPQRANMIANPSFEGNDASGASRAFWSSNGTITQVSGAAPGDGGGYFAGRFVFGGTVIAESNVFPTNREENWTIQFMAKGTGDLKVGFVWWTDEYLQTAVDWGEETWTLSPDSFMHIVALRNPVQTYQGMVRLECSGGSLTIDKVCCETGLLPDWRYFDGDSTYGARNDYSWYGAEKDPTRRFGTYSLWYNNKDTIISRLFAMEPTDNETVVTDELMERQGFAYRWVPAGTTLVRHIDVLYPHDTQGPVQPKTANVVIPYRASVLDPANGVVTPWT